jgi:hypothetical protein
MSGFTFGGGHPVGIPTLIGGVMGDSISTVTMTDTLFFNQFIQNIDPGTTLGFEINLTTNQQSGGVPDEFSFSVLDSLGVEIPTLGPANAFLVIDMDSSSISASTFATDASQSPSAGGAPILINAPIISQPSSLTPEAGC